MTGTRQSEPHFRENIMNIRKYTFIATEVADHKTPSCYMKFVFSLTCLRKINVKGTLGISNKSNLQPSPAADSAKLNKYNMLKNENPERLGTLGNGNK